METDYYKEVPEYKAYMDAHPTEWIDDFIRNKLMINGQAVMPSEGVWLSPRIRKRLNEKFFDWAQEPKFKEYFNGISKDNAEVYLTYETTPLTVGETRGWLFRLEITHP